MSKFNTTSIKRVASKASKGVKTNTRKAKEYYNREKKKKSKKYYVITALIGIFLALFILMILFFLYIVFSAPKFDPSKLYKKEATLLYDIKGKQFASIGSEKREKIEYSDLPEVLVDAIIATEDSRFFQHNGFDLARFLKASGGQLTGNSAAGGASTLTMQVVKNSFTSTTSSGIAGIVRKFTDIYMSVFRVEPNYTKEEIIEFYVNSPYLGSGTYGVEQASQTFFGKSAKDLSLVEAATIAGLFQAPGSYDPYVHPEDAEARRNTVLDLMVRHGYITKEESESAKAIPVKSLLVDDSASNKKTLSKYQGYIDTVVEDVINKTGNNPYNVSMKIYTTMNRSQQNAINNIYNEKTYDFVDKKIQLGISVIDTQTGAVTAVGAGRNKTKELSFNYATMTNKHPGSTAKPIFDYGPGIECEKWSTYTPFFDEPTAYGNTTIKNWDGGYQGFLSMKKALAESRNTCALQAFKKTSNECKVKFVKALGIKAEFGEDDDLHAAHAVGAFNGTSPQDLAAAYAAFANGGYYIKPYTYKKIIYRENGKTITSSHKKTKAMSAETAYMITDILVSATKHNSVSSTQVATKTGTSSYDNEALRKYNVPSSAIQSSWVSFYSPKYSVSFYYGYDKLNSKNYLTMSSGTYQRGILQRVLTRGITESGSRFTRPSTISSVSVELETIPALRPSAYTPGKLRGTFLFIRGTEPEGSSDRFAKLSAPSGVSVSKNGTKATVSWSKVKTPNFANPSWLRSYFASGYEKYANKYYNKRISYNNSTMGAFGYDIYVKVNGSLKKVGFTTGSSYSFTIPNGTTAVVVKTAYKRFKSNQSSGVEKALKGATITMSGSSQTIVKDSIFSIDSNDVTLRVDGKTIAPSSYTVTLGTIYDSSNTPVPKATMEKTPGSYKVSYTVRYNSQTYLSSTYNANISVDVEEP